MVEQIINTRRLQTDRTADDSRSAQAAGHWRGQSVTLRQEKDVDSEIRRAQFREKAGLTGHIDHKSLAERNITLDARRLPMSANMLSNLSKVFGGEKKSTLLSQHYLKYFLGAEKRPANQGSLNDLMQHYTALNKLAKALEVNDADFVTRMTPLPEAYESIAGLTKDLQDAGDQPEKLKDVLGEIEGLPSDAEELHQLMKTLRFSPDALNKKLRNAQKLPELKQDQVKELKEKVEDAICQLEIDEGARIKAARNSIEKGFDSGNPEQFIESYTGALQLTGSFLQTFTLLIQRHKPSELAHVVPLMKQVLADELRLGQEERSTDKTKLECLLSELSFMHISSTLLEKINKLISGMQRIYGQPAAA